MLRDVMRVIIKRTTGRTCGERADDDDETYDGTNGRTEDGRRRRDGRTADDDGDDVTDTTEWTDDIFSSNLSSTITGPKF